MNGNKENAEVIEVVSLEDALRAIRVALSDVEYGESIDDVRAEASSFLESEAFNAVRAKEEQ